MHAAHFGSLGEVERFRQHWAGPLETAGCSPFELCLAERKTALRPQWTELHAFDVFQIRSTDPQVYTDVIFIEIQE